MVHFTKDCCIGIEEIDNDHEHLFSLINETKELIENELLPDKYDKIQELLSELETYADEHFKREEAYMKKINHRELEMQKAQHNIFREKIHTLTIMNIDDTQIETLEDILDFLYKWLFKHIIGSDIMIGKLPTKYDDNLSIFTFTDKFLTHIDLIDKEHKELFRIIGEANELVVNDFLPSKYDQILFLLKELKNYTIKHFSDEEKYMESINYAGLEEQKLEHASFVSRLQQVNLDSINENEQKTLEELIDFLIRWLTYHILEKDLKIK